MKKSKLWSICYGTILTAFTVYAVLDTFVISRSYQAEATQINTSMFDGSSSSDSVSQEDGSVGQSDFGNNSDSSNTGHLHSGRKRHGGKPSGNGSSSGRAGTGNATGQESTKNSTAQTGTENSGQAGTENSAQTGTEKSSGQSQTYETDNTKITLTEYYENNTKIYVADVQLSSAEQLKTAFANDSYGKNVTSKTSTIAEDNNAILAINGDYYGAQESGYVIRNGVVYRDSSNGNDVLCIYADGSFKVYEAGEKTAEELVKEGVWQAFSFGPGLLENGEVTISENEEVGKSMASNPRTAIGMIDNNHYVFVVADGRISESEGLSLYELAEFMADLGVKTAYNLDGGGSSTMYFNGEIINNPTTTGHNIKEREVSDIVYIAKNEYL